MASTTQIPLVDGPAAGTTVTAELDRNGRPALTHHHQVSGELHDAEVYELQAADGVGGWIYRWRGPAGALPTLPTPPNPTAPPA
ncbi:MULTISPECIES: hypothetical protein [Polymorphospora]|uniref:Uncharacterized protein n=1 Tax=Polymorphospora lycopeni TaxID=3140240 RepID=A0ABV5D263_9ACTN